MITVGRNIRIWGAWTLPLVYALLIGLGGLEGVALTVLSLAYLALYAGLTLPALEAAYSGLFGVIAFLPIASFPWVLAGAHLTLLNWSVLCLVLAWAWETRRRPEWPPPSVAWPLVAFLALASLSVIVNSAWLPPRLTTWRRFVEYLLNAGLILVHLNGVRTQDRLEHLLRWLILSAAGAAALGLILHLLPDAQAERFLFNLAPLGYPRTGILRHLLGDPALPLRATGTHFDPNLFGGFVALGLMLSLSQPFAARRLWPWPVLFAFWGVSLAALIASYSRAAIVGSVAALGLIALFDAPLLMLGLAAGTLLLLLLPVTRPYLLHLLAGFAGRDAATQMRFEEYRSALVWIRRYPWLGAGLGGVPDPDLTPRIVSSAYLFIAERWGLPALGAWLATLAATLQIAWVSWRRLPLHLAPLAHAIYATLVGLLVIGLLDHYWVNPDFSHTALLFWLTVSLVLVTHRLQADRHVS